MKLRWARKQASKTSRESAPGCTSEPRKEAHGGGRLGPGLVVGPRTAASAQVPTPCLLRLMLQVMDEADRLLEQGCTDFTVDLEVILAAVPARRQTLLFSATLTDTLRELQGLATNQPFFWEAQAP